MAPSSIQTLIISSSCQSARSEVRFLIGSQATKIDVEAENATVCLHHLLRRVKVAEMKNVKMCPV